METTTDLAVLAQLRFWVRQYADAAYQLRQATIQAALRLLLPFHRWYDPRAVRLIVEQSVKVSEDGQLAAEGLARQYAAQIVSVMRDAPVGVRPITVDPVRNGADPVVVFTRPIEVYQRQISVGKDEATATAMALERQSALVDSNLTLVGREAEVKELRTLGVTRYRRIIHPEEAKSGTSCGLCIAASTVVYKVENLQPMHGHCHCTVMAIEGGADYGDLINRELLDQLYIDSGGTSGQQLRRTRYKVNEHGEYGPVLNSRGNAFRGPKDLGKNDPIGRAVAELDLLRPTLVLLEQKERAGQDVSGPLAYQRDRIATLERIIAAA